MPGSVSHAKRHTISSPNDHIGQLLKTQQQVATIYEDEANAWSVAQNFPTGSQINSELIASEAFVEAAVQSAFIIQSITVTDPSTLTPSVGEMWVVPPGAIGVWATHVNETAEWNGSGWDYLVPTEGWRVWILDEDTSYTFNGTNWIPTGSTITHGNLIGLSNDDHTQYGLLTGRASQTMFGSNISGGFLLFRGSTSNNGTVELGDDGFDVMFIVDEANSLINCHVALNMNNFEIMGGIAGGDELTILGDINNDGIIYIGHDGTGVLIEVDESASTVKVKNNPIHGILTGTSNPDTVVTGSLGQLFRDTLNLVWYICNSDPSGTSWGVM